MKVLQLGPYPPPHGGVQTNLVAIRRYLRERGIVCPAINLTRHRRAETDDVYYPESAAQVVKLVRRLRCDILHLHIGGHVSERLLGLALVCCSMPGSKTVLTLHSGGYPTSPAGLTARPATFRGFVFRRFDRIIAVNEEIARMFRKFGVASEKIRVIAPHAVHAPQADVKLPEPLASFYAAHDPVIVTVSGLEPQYDLALQIGAHAAVRERFPQAGLVIIGAGCDEAELRELIARQPDAEHILLCGDVPHEATLRAISEGDIFLRTTLYDGDAISVREALHAGVPVIATDNGMRPAGVHLIPMSDAAALVAAVTARLADGVERQAQNVEPNDENVAAVYKLYRELSG